MTQADEKRIRQSMANLRHSIYNDGEVDVVDLLQYDMDEEDRKQIMSVVEGSLNRIPNAFRNSVINKFLSENPETTVDVLPVEQEIEDKEIEEISDFALESVKRSRWTLFHKEFQRQQQETFGRTFTIIDPEAFWISVKEKTGSHNDTVRLYSIQKLGNDINNALYTIYKLNTCKMKELKISSYEHFNIFSWTEDKFLARRQMKGIAWVDIFRKSLTEECLDAFKLRSDIMELARLIKLILMSFYPDNDYLASETLTTIYDAFALLGMQNKLLEELQESIDYFCQTINELTAATKRRRTHNQDIIKNFLELELMASWVKNPLENRYQMNSIKQKVADWQTYFDMKERKLEEALAKATTKMQNERSCYESTMQCMYNTIEDYKQRIATISLEYDQRFNDINEKNSFLRSSLDKMKIRREFMEAESIYMKQRVREILTANEQSKLSLRFSKRSQSHASLSGKSRLKQNSRYFSKNSIV
ncbi:uncharacterized protein [Eurosta solidaginis]|uniref:uncharacterized protein n=1 Tax=Eurosta solidaginis TaxID=178769 RepID=UPI00353136EC